jgi:hypothetical protein
MQRLGKPPAAELARDEPDKPDGDRPGDRGQQSQGKHRVAKERADGPEQKDRQRRLIDVAKGQMIGAGQIVELVAEIAVALRGQQMDEQLRRRKNQQRSAQTQNLPSSIFWSH